MSNKTVCILVLFLLLLSVSTVVAPAPTPGPSSGGGGGGGGSKQITVDHLLKAVKNANSQNQAKLDELKKLLYIQPYSELPYDPGLSFGLNVTGGKILDRNDKFEVIATVVNPNPVQIRRALYLDLEILEPGGTSFKTVNPLHQIIQISEYKMGKDNRNYSSRIIPDLTSFADLKEVGPVILRLYATDGVYKWRSQNFTLNVTNEVPRIEDIHLSTITNPRYNDAVIYEANVTDPDGDAVNLTLHILDEHRIEKANATQIVEGTGQIRIIGNKFFGKSDAGRSFYYYYTFGDGMDVNETDVQSGPSFRRSVTLFVQNPMVIPTDQNQYWWQNYNFSLEMKNQGPEESKVRITLYTNTEAHPWKIAATEDVVLTQEKQIVGFDVRPFDVLDANQTFSFRFEYSEPDQDDRLYKEVNWETPLSAKLVRYDTISALGIGNVLLIFALALAMSMLFERRFHR